MMSGEYIVYLSNLAAVRAAVEADSAGDLIQPCPVTNVYEVNAWESAHKLPFPNLGALRPAGWKLTDNFMVDSSGLDDSGWALSLHGLCNRLRENADKGYAYAIIEEGQFQVVVGQFEPDPEAKLTLDGDISDDDWETIAQELGFEDAADLRGQINL